MNNRTPMECPTCGSKRVYHGKHDAYYCIICNAWLESKCNDESCEYCKNRPEKPLDDRQKLD